MYSILTTCKIYPDHSVHDNTYMLYLTQIEVLVAEINERNDFFPVTYTYQFKYSLSSPKSMCFVSKVNLDVSNKNVVIGLFQVSTSLLSSWKKAVSV